MRAHFPGALREVRSAARFPDGFVVRHIYLTNSKEDKHMEKQFTTAVGEPFPDNQEQINEAKCPFSGGARRHTAGGSANAGWWPNQLNLKILHQHSPLSNPM